MAVRVADYFEQADELPYQSLSDIAGAGGVLVLAAHPDDESLGCGGLLAACVEEGRPARVVIVSDGAASHPNSRRFPRDMLRDLRECEARTACAALGLPTEPIFLGLPDSAVPSVGAAADAAIDAIADIARRMAASVLCVTWRHDPHCDHKACVALAQAVVVRLPALRLLEYPVWGHTLSKDATFETPPRGLRFNAAPFLDRKRAAIAAHRSQVTRLIDDDQQGFRLAPEMIARFQRPFETFLEF